MVTLLMFHRLVREHASHLVYHESSSVKSCLSLRTCSVLFQLMSTAGPLARCSEFNERNDHGGIFFFFSLSFFFFLLNTKEDRKLSKEIGEKSQHFLWVQARNTAFFVFILYVIILSSILCQQVTLHGPLRAGHCVWRHPKNVVYLMYNIYLTHFRWNNLNNSTLKLNLFVMFFSFCRP